MPDAEHKVLRDLVRAREAAKKDQLRAPPAAEAAAPARPPEEIKAWTVRYLTWLKTPQLEPAALAATLLDYIAEVDRAHERIERLRRTIE